MSIIKNISKTLLLSVFAITMTFVSQGVNAKSHYKAGDLLKLKGVRGAAVYQIGEDGKKYVYPDENTFKTWYDTFSDVVEVELEDLDEYEEGGTIPFQPGTRLLTHRNTARVYAPGEDGQLVHIPDEETARQFYGEEWYKLVSDIDPGIFAIAYQVKKGFLAANNLPEGALIEEEDSGEYYLIEDGQRRRVLSSIMNNWKLQKKHILKLNRFNNIYEKGDEIDDEDDDSLEFDLGRDKVLVCHKPEIANVTIHVSARALKAHLAHGDYEGRCSGDPIDDDDDDSDDDVDELEVSGLITDWGNDMDVDGQCYIMIEDTKVELKASGEVLPGTNTEVLGSIEGISCPNAATDLSDYVGLEAEAFGLWNGYYLSVQEDDDYYIRVEEEEVELPDIIVSDIMVSPESPVANATTTDVVITVYLENSGTVSLTGTTGILNILASFEDFTETASSTEPTVSEEDSFDPGDGLEFTWTGYFTTAGEKTLSLTADESDELEESDEDNNEYSETVTVLE